MENSNIIYRINEWLKTSVMFKLFIIATLIILLLIPSFMIQSLIEERSGRREEVRHQVAQSWGENQVIAGPLLKVPIYYTELTAEKEEIQRMRNCYITPVNLQIDAVSGHEERIKSIYRIPVYEASCQLKGKFELKRVMQKLQQKGTPDWSEASLHVFVSDIKGLKTEPVIYIGKKKAGLSDEGETLDGLTSFAIDPAWSSEPENFDFDIQVALQGSQQLHLVPVGEETVASVQSDWPHPGFTGAFAPARHTITPAGFTAHWDIYSLRRNIPLYWSERSVELKEYKFGYEMVEPVDHYHKSMRAAKYAIILIVFSFLIFFIIETMYHKHVHPVQYLLVGTALCLFYTLLLSLSEMVAFNLAYAISAVMVVGLITWYAHAVFKSITFTKAIGALLILMFGFMMVLLQLQDIALLVGSIGLFLLLAMAMYITRNIDWYGVKLKKA